MRPTYLIAAAFLLGLRIAAAATLAPGMQLPEITLADQHDVKASIGPEVRIVIFTRDMDAAGIVEEALAADGAAALANANAVFVSDIHRMPGMISKLFALPAMRKRPYRMMLDRNGVVVASWPGLMTRVRIDEVIAHLEVRVPAKRLDKK